MKIIIAMAILFNIVCMCGCNTDYDDPVETTVVSCNSVLTKESFKNISIGTSFDEVVNMVGIPQFHTGFGIIWDVYKLNDGSAVMLLFCDNLVANLKNVPAAEVDSYLIYCSE